jgi:uncharacterized protein (TIGR02118 family)
MTASYGSLVSVENDPKRMFGRFECEFSVSCFHPKARHTGGTKMPKIMFILHRRQDVTHDECLRYWSGPIHTPIVKRVPGLTKWVQNHVVGPPGELACDGVGELWFDSEEAMTGALNSAEMAAAVEDAKNFLDMNRTGLIIVQEKTVA